VHEVVAYLLKRAQVATQRIYDMTHTTRLALSSSPTLRYVPPKVGFIRIRTTEGFSCAEDAGLFKPISNSQVICSVVSGWFVLMYAVTVVYASALFSVIRGSVSC
jgi:hypothetical protein